MTCTVERECLSLSSVGRRKTSGEGGGGGEENKWKPPRPVWYEIFLPSLTHANAEPVTQNERLGAGYTTVKRSFLCRVSSRRFDRSTRRPLCYHLSSPFGDNSASTDVPCNVSTRVPSNECSMHSNNNGNNNNIRWAIKTFNSRLGRPQLIVGPGRTCDCWPDKTKSFDLCSPSERTDSFRRSVRHSKVKIKLFQTGEMLCCTPTNRPKIIDSIITKLPTFRAC